MSFENFGRIKEGEIEIAPLVVIVGDNNSGKSYVMSLLWGLLTEGRKLFPKDVPTSKNYKAVDLFLNEVIGENRKLTKEEMTLFIDWFNDLLQNQKQELTQRIFRKKITVSALRIENYRREKAVELKFDQKGSQLNPRYSKGKDHIRFPFTAEKNVSAAERYRMAQYITWFLLMEDLTSPLSSMGGPYTRASGEALYLPASRTGFMLTYRALVQEMMETRIEGDVTSGSEFTLPVYRFLQGLLDLDGSANSKFKDIGNYIEANILSGEMKQSKGVVPIFSYKPAERKEELPLYLSSSLVTELAPLTLFLKSKTTYKTLFFEEVEAHLHPGVQRVLATALVKLVNEKMPVFMTTHSDLILQQFNNLIKLYAHPDKERLMEQFNYSNEDLLNPNDVKAYQFRIDKGKTVINELEATPYGFPAETFNQVLLELQEETIEFQEDDHD